MRPGKTVGLLIMLAMQFTASSSQTEATQEAGGPSDPGLESTAAANKSGPGQGEVDPKPSWLREALPDVASFLRSHKFNEIDRRYRKFGTSSPQGFHASFPDPPLRSWHWEVNRNCISGFEDCVRYVNKVARRAASFRQRHGGRRRRAGDKAVAGGCRAEIEKYLRSGGSFDGPLERFQWRTTASYFMCWYTMLRVPALETIGRRCDNYATCLEPDDEVGNGDFRAGGSDGKEAPFGCAQYSFCPDPCCPGKHYSSQEECASDPEGPCSGLEGQCSFHPEENTHLDDIAHNRWNVSCNCSSAAAPTALLPTAPTNATLVLKESGGYEWQSRFGLCTDVDECSLGSDDCDRQRESCLNLPGGYACVCRFGFTAADMILDRGKLDLECLRDKALQAAAVDMTAGGHFGKPAAEKGTRSGSLLRKALRILGWGPKETPALQTSDATSTAPAHYLLLLCVTALGMSVT